MDLDTEPAENDHHIWRPAIVVSQSGDNLFVATSKYTTILNRNTPSEDASVAKIGDHLEVKTEAKRDTRPGSSNTKIYIYRQHRHRFCRLFFKNTIAHIVSCLKTRELGGRINGTIQVLESEFIERIYDRDAIYSNIHPINQKYLIMRAKDVNIVPDSIWIVKSLVDDDYRDDVAACSTAEERRLESDMGDRKNQEKQTVEVDESDDDYSSEEIDWDTASSDLDIDSRDCENFYPETLEQWWYEEFNRGFDVVGPVWWPERQATSLDML